MNRLHVLVTNDDGIDSLLFKKLVYALKKCFDVTIAAPKQEKSWISKAVSRRDPVSVMPLEGWDCPGWVIDGTPTDCVNIALGHLLDSQPDAVVSGTNIGYNTTLSLLFSSGTVSGALEGACWGIPAFAFSQSLTPALNKAFDKRPQAFPKPLEQVFDHSAARACELTAEIMNQPTREGVIVHNINFPVDVGPETRVIQAAPEQARGGIFFARKTDSCYIFTPPTWESEAPEPQSDRDWLYRGFITHSVLDYTGIYSPPAGLE